jgi:hypothetical protein
MWYIFINLQCGGILIDYYMAFFISHVISIRYIHISPRAEGPKANIGQGLIWHVVWTMPNSVVFNVCSQHVYHRQLFWNYRVKIHSIMFLLIHRLSKSDMNWLQGNFLKTMKYIGNSGMVRTRFVHSLYMINRLWYGIVHTTCDITPWPILAFGPSALGLIWMYRIDMTCDMKNAIYRRPEG